MHPWSTARRLLDAVSLEACVQKSSNPIASDWLALHAPHLQTKEE
jgi:hypothetical protein